MMRISLLAAVIVATITPWGACSKSDDRPTYDVTVTFNGSYTDAAGAAIESAIRSIDADAEVLLQETFPPIARATIRSRRIDVCETILAVTSARAEVAGVNCDRSYRED